MSDVDTTIGSMVKITGNITSEGNVIIHGTVEKGEVRIDGHLTVGETAQISGNINADSVTVFGKVKGNITSANDLTIGGTGNIKGDVRVGTDFVIERGGAFLGKSEMPDTSVQSSFEDVETDDEDKEEDEDEL